MLFNFQGFDTVSSMTDGAKRQSRNGPWQVHTTQTAFENPWIRIETSEVTHPNGEPGTYGVVRYANLAIGILPIDDEGFVWLVGQHRFPFDAYSWELPEGGGPKSEDPLISAQRELKEETGLSAAHWQEIGGWHLSNSVSDERAVAYIACELSPGEASPEPSEALEIRRIPFGELVDMCLAGDITDAFTVLMVLTALGHAMRGDLPDTVAAKLLLTRS